MHNVVLMSIIGGSNWRLLPHWLEHYDRLGIRRHILAINDDARYDRYAGILAEWGVTPMERFSELYAAGEKTHRPRLNAYARPDEWVVYADLDEFYLFPKPLPQLIDELEAGAGDFVWGPIVDHIAADGGLPAVLAQPTIWEQFPRMYTITRDIRKGGSTKVMLRRGRQPMCRGNHDAPAGSRRYPRTGEVHHFRWDETLVWRIREFLARWPDCTHAGEFRRTLDFLGDPPRWDLPALESCRIRRTPLLPDWTACLAPVDAFRPRPAPPVQWGSSTR